MQRNHEYKLDINDKIDFEEYKFNAEIESIRRSIPNFDLSHPVSELKTRLATLLVLFQKHYPSNANNLYSQYLQYLAYYFCIHHKGKRDAACVISTLLDDPLFYFADKAMVCIWQNPKTTHTAFSVLCIDQANQKSFDKLFDLFVEKFGILALIAYSRVGINNAKNTLLQEKCVAYFEEATRKTTAPADISELRKCITQCEKDVPILELLIIKFKSTQKTLLDIVAEHENPRYRLLLLQMSTSVIQSITATIANSSSSSRLFQPTSHHAAGTEDRERDYRQAGGAARDSSAPRQTGSPQKYTDEQREIEFRRRG